MEKKLLVDLHTHPVAHGEFDFARENLEKYITVALKRGCRDLGFSDHDIYADKLDLGIIENLRTQYPQINLRVGLEVDYRGETELPEALRQIPYDYLIGSVHEIDGWVFDYPDHMEGYKNWQGDDLYRAYFELIIKAARSGLFQIIGHLDVISVFNFKSASPLLGLALPALEEIRDAGLALEINTNGKYKPVGRFYPAYDLVARAYDMGIPITLGSDAHEPSNVARDFTEAVELLKSVGYREIVTFEGRQRLKYPL